MKKSLFYLFALICSMSLLTSCGDDDEIRTEEVNATFTPTDAANKLVLTYSGAPLIGKAVTFNTTDGKTATIVLKGGALNLPMGKSNNTPSMTPGVIPGELTTTLNVELTSPDELSYQFSGTDNKAGRILNYRGKVKKGELTLDLTVKMPANNLMGKWDLAPVIINEDIWGGANLSQPIYTAWESTTAFYLDLWGMGGVIEPMKAGDLLTMATSVMPLYADKTGNDLLLSVFKSVTFKEDGNIVASYSAGKNLNNPVWMDSPVNIAQYYVKDNKVYVLLNFDMVLAALMPKNPSTRMDIALILPELIKNVLPMLPTGIPLVYTQKDDKMKVYVDTELMMKLMSVIEPLLKDPETIKEILASVAANPSLASYAKAVKEMFEQLPGVLKTTSKFELGINLNKGK